MRKILFLSLALVILVALALPTAVMADPPPAVSPVFLQNTGSVPPTGYQWHFVLNQLEDPDAGTPTLYVLWDNGGGWSDPITGEVNNTICFFYVPVNGNHVPVFTTNSPTQANCTYAVVPGLSKGNLVVSKPTAVPPVPELPAVALFGLGLAGIGAFLFIKRRKRITAAG
jgi:LPXTG-motif cell wall-anchored protein